MQALDAITLQHHAAELNDLLAGAKINRIQHPDENEFLINVWGGGGHGSAHKKQDREGRNNLYINLNPALAFCALIDNREKDDLVITTLEKPTGFCMLLRKHLNGARILAVENLPGERVINLRLENFNEMGNKAILILSLELMGKHTNMLLVDDVQGLILGVAHTVSGRMSSRRELAGGLPYAPPPKPSGKQPVTSVTPEDLATRLAGQTAEEQARLINRQLEGIGSRMAEDALSAADSPADVHLQLLRLVAGKNLRPAVSEDGQRFTLLSPADSGDWHSKASVSELVHDYCLHHLKTQRMEHLRQGMRQALSRFGKRLEKQREELKPVDPAEVEALQHMGDLILSAFSSGNLPPRPDSGEISLTDFATGQPVRLGIDPALSWPENADVYYRRAKKNRARQDAFNQMKSRLDGEAAYAEELALMTDQADSVNELLSIREDLVRHGLIKPVRLLGSGGDGGKFPSGVAEYQSSDGFRILVGKSGHGNAEIVGKLSRPEDWWLHVHEMPGSHVLIKVEKEDDVSDQAFLEAANLAVWFSKARHSKNVPVIYTDIRYVRKIPDSYPGHVTYKSEFTEHITADPDIIARLTGQA